MTRPRAPGRRRLPAAERRRQIAEVALRLLATRGGSALTLAELSAEIGIADASILRHLPSKEAIVDAAISLFVDSLAEDFPRGVDDPAERLRAFFVSRLHRVSRQPELLSLAFNTRLQDSAGESGVRRIRRTIARSTGFVRDCVVELQQAGRLPRDVPPQVFVWTITGVLRGAALGAPSGTDALEPEQVEAHLARLLGLKTAADAPRPRRRRAPGTPR